MNTVTPDTKPGVPVLPLDWTQVKKQRRNDNGDSQDVCCTDPSSGCRRLGRHRLGQGEAGIHGHVVFCLHEINPSWFQGYFIPLGTRRPWGLLAVQEEIDDCLACADGGFRRITLTIYPPSGQPIKLATTDWTGGDLIQLRHEQLDVESNRILTGTSSLALVETYFKGLVRKLREECEVDEDEPVLEWLPDIAIVSGKMILVPKIKKEGEE
jgi:hypothetical protein